MDKKYTEIWHLLHKATPEQKKQIINKLSDEDLIQLRYRANPYRKPIYKPKSKFIEMSYFNMNRDYEKKFMMTSMVGFMYKMATEYQFPLDEEKYPSEQIGQLAIEINNGLRKAYGEKIKTFYEKKQDTPEDKARYLRAMALSAERLGQDHSKLEEEAKNFCKENKIRFETVFPEDVPLDAEEIEQVKQEAKKKLNIRKTLEEKITERQDHLLDFMDYYFRFDPNNHIRCNYYPDFDEILKEKVKSNPGKFKYQNGMIVTENFEEYLVPPLDTFHALDTYIKSNYEHLRQCTNDIYKDTSQFEIAICPREVFNSPEDAEKWEDKYRTDFDVSVMRVNMGEWTFIDDFQKNRDTIRLNDDKSRLIREFLEKKKEEEKMGQDLLKKRKNKIKDRPTSDLPFESKMEEYCEKDNDINQQITSVYQTKIIRSRRLKYGFDSKTIPTNGQQQNPLPFSNK